MRALAVLLLAAGCYSPSIPNGKQMCAPGGQCASGYSCGADHLCYLGQAPKDGGGGARDLAMPRDLAGAADAAFGCAKDADCSGDTPRCDVTTSTCVPCLPTNDNCTGGSFCSMVNGSYACTAGCKVDGDCAQPDGGGPVLCCNHACLDVSANDANCGACGKSCNGQTCCASACVDTTSDVKNCGGCNKPCSAPNATSGCSGSACTIATCTGTFADCDKVVKNGCEVNIASDALHCGSCAKACVNGQACSNSSCQGCTHGTMTFAATGTVDTFVVPCAVVTIEAFGAQGGNVNGGKGARMKGDFTLTVGDKLSVAVGKQGVVNNCGGAMASGGGGGGTFVWRTADTTKPLLVAGGGGGGNKNFTGGPANCWNGIDAVITPNGTAGNDAMSAAGGVNGAGGAGNAPSGTGSGGTGWLSAGQDSTYGTNCTGGKPQPTFAGGAGSTSFGPGGQGGFGGGGGAVCGCGGGGGYSGGGAGEGSSCRAGGGGGGSINAGANQSNSPAVQLGDGQVIFTW